MGLLTKRDKLSIGFNSSEVEAKISYFLDTLRTTGEVCAHFGLIVKDNDRWDADVTRSKVKLADIPRFIQDCQYRPLDNRKVFFHENFVARMNPRVMRHLTHPNYALIVGRQGQAVGGDEWNVAFVTNYLSEQNIYRRGGGTVFPLYLYKEAVQPRLGEQLEGLSRIPNLNFEIVNEIGAAIGLTFKNEPDEMELTFSPIDILDLSMRFYIAQTTAQSTRNF